MKKLLSEAIVYVAKTEKPTQNETVWFFVQDGKCHIHCMIRERTGWHLGWWSGSRWHSYFDESIRDDDSKVKFWLPLGLPEIDKG